MLSASLTCPSPTTNLPILTPDGDTYLVAETKTDQNTYISGKVSLPQAILNAGIPLTNTVVDSWVVTNSSNIGAATAWFLANNVKIGRYTTWLVSNSGSLLNAATWLQSNSSNLSGGVAAGEYTSTLNITDPTQFVRIQHNLNTTTPLVQVYNSSTGTQVLVSIDIVDEDSVDIKIGEGSVAGNYNIVVIGGAIDNNTTTIDGSLYATWVIDNSAAVEGAVAAIETLTAVNISASVATWVTSNSSTFKTMNTWFGILTAVQETHEEIERQVFTWVTENSSGIHTILTQGTDNFSNWVIVNSGSYEPLYNWYASNSAVLHQSATWVCEQSANFAVVKIALNDALLVANRADGWIDTNSGALLRSSSWTINNSAAFNTALDTIDSIVPDVTASVPVTTWWNNEYQTVDQVTAWITNLTGTWVSQAHIEAVEELFNPFKSWVGQNSSNVEDVYTLLQQNSAYYDETYQWVDTHSRSLTSVTSWVQANSSRLDNIEDVKGWVQETSSIIPSLSASADWLDEFKSFIVQIQDWYVDNAQQLVQSVAVFNDRSQEIFDTIDWVNDNSIKVSSVYAWMQSLTSKTPLYDDAVSWIRATTADLNSSLGTSSWLQANQTKLTEIENWYDDNVQQVGSVAGVFAELSADEILTQAWVQASSSSIQSVDTWVESNSSHFNTVKTWYTTNHTDIENTVVWADDNRAKYDDVVSWVGQNSSNESVLSTWTARNSARLNDATTLLETTSSNIPSRTSVESTFYAHRTLLNTLSTWTVSNSAAFARDNTFTTENSADIIETVTWVANSSYNIDSAVAASWWIGENSLATEQTNAWVEAISDTVTETTNWVSIYGTVLNNSRTWVQTNSSKLDIISTWYSSNSSIIDDTIDTFASLSAGYDSAENWVVSNSALANRVATWTQLNSASIALDSVRDAQVAAWTQVNSSIAARAAYAADWIDDNKNNLQAVQDWYDSSSSIIDESASFVNAVSSSIEDTVTWTQDNSGDVKGVVDWVTDFVGGASQARFGSTLTDQQVFGATFTSPTVSFEDITQATTFTQEISSAIQPLSASYDWLSTRKTDIAQVVSWALTTGLGEISQATTFTTTISSILQNVATWTIDNSANVAETTAWVAENDSVIDKLNQAASFTQRTSAALPLLSSTRTWVEENKTEISQAVEWVLTSGFEEVSEVTSLIETLSSTIIGVASWAVDNSASLQNAQDWVAYVDGTLASIQQAASFTQRTSAALPLLSSTRTWVEENKTDITQALEWVQSASTALPLLSSAREWVEDFKTDISQSVVWTQGVSAALPLLSSTRTWVEENQEDILQTIQDTQTALPLLSSTRTWVEENKTDITQALEWVQNTGKEVVSEASNFVATISSLLEDTITWTVDNSADVDAIDLRSQLALATAQGTLPYTTWTAEWSGIISNLNQSLSGVVIDKEAIYNTVSWAVENSASYEEVLSHVQATSAEVYKSWVESNSANVAQTNAWVTEASSIVKENQNASTYLQTTSASLVSAVNQAAWVSNYKNILLDAQNWVIDNSADLNRVATWVQQNSSTTVSVYSQEFTINDTMRSVDIIHGLDASDVIVQIYDDSSERVVIADITAVDDNRIRIDFGTAPAGVYKVVIFGNTNLHKQNTTQTYVTSWVLGNSGNLNKAMTWLRLLTGVKERHEALEESVFSWAVTTSSFVEHYKTSLNAVDWLVDNYIQAATVINTWSNFASAELSRVSARSHTALSGVNTTQQWIQANNSAVSYTTSWLQSNSSTVSHLNDIQTWTTSQSSALNRAVTWISTNEAPINVFLNWVTTTQDNINRVNTWAQSNSAIIATGLKTGNEALAVGTGAQAWISSNGTSVLDNNKWVSDNKNFILEASKWVTALSAVKENHEIQESDVFSWVARSSSTLNALADGRYTSWVTANSAILNSIQTYISQLSTTIQTESVWVKNNKADLAYSIRWVQENANKFSITSTNSVLSLVLANSSLDWIGYYNEQIQQANAWVRSSSAAIYDTALAASWVVKSSANSADATTWVRNSSSDINRAVTWFRLITGVEEGHEAAEKEIHAWVNANSALIDASMWVRATSARLIEDITWVETNSSTFTDLYSYINVTSAAYIDTYNWVTSNRSQVVSAKDWVFERKTSLDELDTFYNPISTLLYEAGTWVNIWKNSVTQATQWTITNAEEVDSVVAWVEAHSADATSVFAWATGNSAQYEQAAAWVEFNSASVLNTKNRLDQLYQNTQPSITWVEVHGADTVDTNSTVQANSAMWALSGATDSLWVSALGITTPVGALNPGDTFVGKNAIYILEKMLYGIRQLQITTQPAAKTVNPGVITNLTVSAVGTEPILYQWYKDSVALQERTEPILTFANVAENDQGTYYVTVSNVIQTITSNTAILTVRDPVQITQQPTSAPYIVSPLPISLTTVVIGSTPVYYQWFKNDVIITGATSPNYTVTNTTSNNSGTYKLSAYNAVNSVVSNGVPITIVAGVQITQQPTSATINPGGSIVLSVQATGTPTITYQWTRNNIDIADAIDSVYTATEAGSYAVKVSNYAGTVLSNTATVTVRQAVSIDTQPQDQSVTEGSSITLQVVATGSPTLTYQWFKDGFAVVGATSSTYTIANSVKANHEGSYHVAVTNPVGTVISSVVSVSISIVDVVHSVVFIDFKIYNPSTQQELPTSSLSVGQTLSYSEGLTFKWVWNSVGDETDWYDERNPGSTTTTISYKIGTSTAVQLTAVRYDAGDNSHTGTASITIQSSDLPSFTSSAAATLQFILNGKGVGVTQPVGGEAVPTQTVNKASWAYVMYWGKLPFWRDGEQYLLNAGNASSTYNDVIQQLNDYYTTTRIALGYPLGHALGGVVALTNITAFPSINVSTFTDAFAVKNANDPTSYSRVVTEYSDQLNLSFPDTTDKYDFAAFLREVLSDADSFASSVGEAEFDNMQTCTMWVFAPASLPTVNNKKWAGEGPNKNIVRDSSTNEALGVGSGGTVTFNINGTNVLYDAYRIEASKVAKTVNILL